MFSGRHVLLGLAILVFVVANTLNALNKGGDAQDFFEGGRRLLAGAPLYQGSSPASGFIGPPFQAAFFVPFGWLSMSSDVMARLAWYVLNLVCLVVGVVYWTRAWGATRAAAGLGPIGSRNGVWLALLAILLPLQTNFEHQNMNPLLLAISGLTAWSLVGGRLGLAGTLIGFAAALKVFPALAIVYVATRRWWTCAAAAIGCVVVLTVLPLAVYGSSFAAVARNWWSLASGGWPTRVQNQSLLAAIDRLWPGGPETAVHNAHEVPDAWFAFVVAAAALVALGLAIAGRRRLERPPVTCEFAVVTVLAVLLSPVAWEHYWVLLFPAYLLIHDAQDPRLVGRAGGALFWTAAILTSGLSRLTLGSTGWALARQLSVDTLAALLLYVGLCAMWRPLARHQTGARASVSD